VQQVATRAAIDMAADKLICMTVPETQPIALPLWTPLADAERVLFSLIADRIPDVEPGSGAPDANRPPRAPRLWRSASFT
jgi:hypothetical protein